jgi:hypothetical protein
MEGDCPVGDLKILWHLFQQIIVQQKLYTLGNIKDLKE